MAYGEVVLNPGVAGDAVAVDTISARDFQRVKLSLGAEGAAVDAVAGAGAVSTAVQRVTLASDDPAVTALQIMDDWDESDRAKVNPIVGQAGVAAGAGAVGATVQRVTLASDDPLVALATTTGVKVQGMAAENAAAAGNPNLVGGRYDASDRTLGDADVGAIALDVAGRVKITGTANMAAAATGGYTPGFLIAANTMNATNVKASAGTLGFFNAFNLTDDVLFLKLFNKATTPDPSADSALCVGVYPIPANTDLAGAGFAIALPPQGINFSTGIGFAITAALAVTDETAVAANSVAFNYGFA